ncbi:MAG: translation initiation factor IF-2 N-terminal domain-containing protein, partial [Desulfohalobiaceae bacterium]
MATKMRVRELSTELDISNKELLHLLRDLGIQVKSHMSTIPEEEVERVRERFSESARGKDVTEKVTRS